MECNEGKWNIYKIILIKSLKTNDHKNTSEYWTEGPQLDEHINHDYNYFSTHGNTIISISLQIVHYSMEDGQIE